MIDFKLMYNKMKINNTYVKTILITDFPDRAAPGFLYNFTHGEFMDPEDEYRRVSVNLALHIRKAEINFDWKTKTKMNRLQNSIASYNTGKASDTPRVEEEKALAALQQFRDGQSNNYVEVFFLITIASDDKRLFRKRVRKLKNQIKYSKFKYDELKLEQHLGLSAAWAGGNKKVLNKYHGRIMDMDSLSAFYPYLDGTISDGIGAYIGHRTKNGTAVYRNFKESPDDQNIIVTGTTGGGKSTEIKALIQSMLSEGMKGYVYDVDGEYYALCEKEGGEWVDLTMKSGKFVDPTLIERSIFDEVDPEDLNSIDLKKAKDADEGRYMEALNNTLGIIGLLVDDFTNKKSNAAEYALLKMWKDAGIKEDDSNTWTIREGVDLHKMFEIIKDVAFSEENKQIHKDGSRELYEDLWSYFEGGKKHIFQNATSSEWLRDSKLTVFHVASSVDNEADQKLGAIKIVMVSQMVWQQVKRDRLKKKTYSFGVYYELQRLIKNPYASKSVYRDVTTGRKFNYQTILGFNDPSILFPNNEGLWNNTKYKILFGLESKTIDELSEFGAMPHEVISEWKKLNKYQYIFCSGIGNEKKYDILRAEIPKSELELSKTRGLS